MKDLIMITAYCPDDTRETILRNLVTSLEKHKNIFDVMITSHTPIPLDIQKKVDVSLFDKKNEMLTDWDLLNQPWFNPNDERRIQSSFLSKKNTHLAIWRLMILGFSTAKNMGYRKVHHIEYDCEINEISEFIDNSELLNKNNSVVYMDVKHTVDEVMFGSFQSYFIPKIHKLLIELDEEKIKDLIRGAISKSPEALLLNLIEDSGNVIFKHRNILEQKGNRFGIVDGQVDVNFIPWALPFYDKLTNEIGFIVWNTKNENGVTHQIIINDVEIITVPKTELNHWRMINLGLVDNIKKLLIIENNKIRDEFKLENEKDIEIFKKMSFRHTENF